MSFNHSDQSKNRYMLTGSFKKKGYDWWWHNFTGINRETGEEKAFFIEFFLCNPGLGSKKPILGQSMESKVLGLRPSYLMVKAGCWGKDARQLHRFFGWDNVLVDVQTPYCIIADDCYASEDTLQGSVSVTEKEKDAHPEYMSDAGSMSWNLKIDKQVAFNVGYGTSKLLCALKAFEMYWHAEGMKTAFFGEVILDGVTYDVKPKTCYGYADKNWGRNFTSPWLWLSGNDIVDKETGKRLEDSVFDIGGGRPKVYFLPLPRKLLGAFWYEGKAYEFNFSKFWKPSKTRFAVKETDDCIKWLVIQENKEVIMKTRVSCKKEDMILVNYESPDGKKCHNRLWNGGNGKGHIELFDKRSKEKIADLLVGHMGCEYGEYDADETRRSPSDFIYDLNIKYTKRIALQLKRRFGRVWKSYTRSLRRE